MTRADCIEQAKEYFFDRICDGLKNCDAIDMESIRMLGDVLHLPEKNGRNLSVALMIDEVPEILDLYRKGDWGRWGEKGKLYANFLSNCDITGGNSGSPVFDGRGRLVGLAFDGNKEGLAGDTYFDPQMNKCISVDIRFVLWTLEKYMHADALLSELDIVTK